VDLQSTIAVETLGPIFLDDLGWPDRQCLTIMHVFFSRAFLSLQKYGPLMQKTHVGYYHLKSDAIWESAECKLE